MNEGTEKKTTALALVENRTHRPAGGCVGIFFKLFNWNRRFAKEKLFSKKLLPSVLGNKVTNKFLGDENLPKHRLIADENRGGFPHVKKTGTRNVVSENKHETRAPGLIARLMGLDSVPSVHKDKSRNVSLSGTGTGRGEEGITIDHKEFNRKDLNLEDGGMKQELRLPKLQKTGLLEKRPLANFGSEAFQFKNALPRPRKHHPKLTSPVKSSRRGHSGRRASILTGAATKILEPGLQAKSREKSALTCRNYACPSIKDEVMFEWTPTLSMDSLNNSSCYVRSAESQSGQSSCTNWSSSADAVNFKLKREQQPFDFASSVSTDIDLSSQGSPKSSAPFLEQQSQTNFQEIKDYSATGSDRAVNNMQPSSERISDRKPLYEYKMHSNLKSEHGMPKKDVPSSTNFKQNTPRKSRVHSKFNKLQHGKVSLLANASSEPKKFVALNQCLSSCTHSRTHAKVDNCKMKEEKESTNWLDNSFSPARKRRLMNDSRQVESLGFATSTVSEPRNVSSNTMHRKGTVCNAAPSMTQTCIRTRFSHLTKNNQLNVTGNENKDVIAFTFSSPMEQMTKISAQLERRIGQNGYIRRATTHKRLALDKNENTECLQKPLQLRGDVLGLLEEKLKELTCQEEKLAMEEGQPKKTTAIILQELISALTMENSFPKEDVALRCKQKNCSHCDVHISNTKTPITFQAQTTARASAHVSREGDHCSPGSVFEASFSNESCFSGSLDDISGKELEAIKLWM